MIRHHWITLLRLVSEYFAVLYKMLQIHFKTVFFPQLFDLENGEAFNALIELGASVENRSSSDILLWAAKFGNLIFTFFSAFEKIPIWKWKLI